MTTHNFKKSCLSIICYCIASVSTLMVAPASYAGFINGFEGTGLLDNVALGNAFRPPDTMGAVGTNQFLESTNGSYTVYNKYTGAVQQRISFGNFWSNAGQSASANGDQRILFDHYTNRWISIGFGATVSDINIAISSTSDAMGPWKSTKFTGFAGGTADYPTLGMDDKGVYIATNNFTSTFKGVSLFSIPKSDLFGFTPTTANMTAFVSPVSSVTDRGFAIQGAVNWGGNPTNTASIMAVDLLTNNQRFYRVMGVNGVGATQTASTLIGGVGYDSPKPARQPDGTRQVDALDDRISSNVYQTNGKLYSVHTVIATGNDYDVVRWSVVDANTGVLISEGDIGLPGCDFYQGAIAANEFGEVVINYNRSCGRGVLSGNENRISFLGRQFTTSSGGGLVQFGSEMLFRVSDVDDYHCGSRIAPTSCRQRWGDYSAVTIDPLNHHNFYGVGEYAAEWANLSPIANVERAIWHTYIAAVSFDVPEPGSITLFCVGLLALTRLRRNQKK